jgi:hypothetical protein
VTLGVSVGEAWLKPADSGEAVAIVCLPRPLSIAKRVTGLAGSSDRIARRADRPRYEPDNAPLL